MALWFVYVVRCRDDSLYTGITTDVASRVAVHNAGTGARYTRARRPVQLVHVERKRSRSTALRREAHIKSLSRRQKVELVSRPAQAQARPRARPAAVAVVAMAGFMVGLMAGGTPRPARGDDGPASASEPSTRPSAPSAPSARPSRLPVPAGVFIEGSTKGDDDERPAHTQMLKRFFIDRTEVTQTAYLACVRAARCRRVPERFRKPVGGDGQLPVTGVSWFDARDYCRFAGGRLPTEAEWEKAARGTDGREYPWGPESSCARANWGNFDGEGPCAGQNPGFPVAVGRYEAGASPYGALDMAGNVWEWVADRYEDEAARRVVRGGSCCSYFVAPRAANRNAWEATYRDGDLGFRCAADR
jgi:formylglycine-generating enzyme required for sulfatase activity